MEQFKAVLAIVGTLVLIVLVFAGAYYTSKFVGRGIKFPGQKAESGIEILSSTFLGKDRSLVVVRVAGKVLLLGLTAQRIEKLEELPPEQFPDQPVQPVPSDFLTMLNKAWKERTGKSDKEDGTHQ